MNTGDFLLLVLVAAGVLLALRSIRRQRKRGGCCGSGCSGCCSQCAHGCAEKTREK